MKITDEKIQEIIKNRPTWVTTHEVSMAQEIFYARAEIERLKAENEKLKESDKELKEEIKYILHNCQPLSVLSTQEKLHWVTCSINMWSKLK